MDESVLKLSLAALLPVMGAILLYLADNRTKFGHLPSWVRQLFFGVIFGAFAIVGTEWGIPMNGAQVNCRDAAVLIGGLLFGAPAGIIAGLIGGIERWIAVAWGVGSFTRVACTLSTIIAGFYAAALRKFLFEDKRPGWFISFAIGVVMEVFHLTMVFITNMATPEKAMEVVRACSTPMIVSNGISVMLAAIFIALISEEKLLPSREEVHISQAVQRWLLAVVALAFLATSFFVFRLQNELATTQTDALLSAATDEVAYDLLDASDENLLRLCRMIAPETEEGDLMELAALYGVSEIDVVNEDGIITRSTEPNFVGYDMASGAQSAAFLCLNQFTEEYVQAYGPISYDENIMRKYAGVATETGFVQVAYDAERFQQDIATQVKGLSKNRHVGKTGLVVITDARGYVVSAPEMFNASSFIRQTKDVSYPAGSETFSLVLDDVTYFAQRRMTEGYSIIALQTRDEALQMRNIALYVNTFMEILAFAVLFSLIYLLIKRIVVDKLKVVTCSLGEITAGKLDEVVDVRSSTEFASLSDDINSTVDTLKRYITEANARIDAELQFAKSIQASALPSKFPAFPLRRDFDIYASMDPAKEVGGDFYDFYMTGRDDLHFLIADVSGKGIPAAMFMMRAKTELKSLTEAEMPVNEVFTTGNRALCEGNDAGMFVTAWQGGIDLKTGLVRYANAGHNPPLVRHAADGKFTYLRSRAGFVLAGMEGVRYKPQELQLMPGDTIFLYTDGVTEATNAGEELYGEERLLKAINEREYETMEELCKAIKADVDAFVGDAPQFDDITMVALRYDGEQLPTFHVERAVIDDVTPATAFLEEELEKLGCPMKAVIQCNVALDEIFSNIVNYGYPKGPGPVTIKLIERLNPHRVYIRFEDQGIPYNPLTNEDPDVTLSAEERGVGGLGIYMVKKTMDDVKYMYEDGKNILSIMKLIGD